MSSILERDLGSSLAGLVAFVRAAEAGSFATAGRRLGVSASAIAKSVARLEERLGVRLMQRTTRSLALTEEGRLLAERASRLLDELREAEDVLAGTRERPRGRLKLGAPSAFGQFVLAPALPEFVAAHPEIEVEAHFDDRLAEVIEEGFDVVVRIGAEPPDSPNLTAKRLGPHRFVVGAAPDYLARRGVPTCPADLERHECIRFVFAATGRPQPWWFVRDGELIDLEPRGRLAFTSNAAMLAAGLAGHGIVYLPDYVVHAPLQGGALRPVLVPFTSARGAITAMWPRARRLAPKVRALIDWLAALMRG